MKKSKRKQLTYPPALVFLLIFVAAFVVGVIAMSAFKPAIQRYIFSHNNNTRLGL